MPASSAQQQRELQHSEFNCHPDGAHDDDDDAKNVKENSTHVFERIKYVSEWL